MSRKTLRASVCPLLLCLLLAAPAMGAPKPPFGHAGQFITDSTGRVFISHGVNLVYKVPPYEPSVSGFGEAAAAFLESAGFDRAALRGSHRARAPPPGLH